MGRSLAHEHSVARSLYARAETAIGYDVLRAGDNVHQELDRGEVVQPALLAYGAAAWSVMAAAGLSPPAAMAGHSLGEIAALVCAEALDLEEALLLAQLRGRLMAKCRTGRMAVVFGLQTDTVAAACASVTTGQVVVANRNSTEQCVISGDTVAVETAGRIVSGMGGVVRPLAVEVAAHSPLMEPAVPEFAEAVARAEIQAPRLPVVSSLTGRAFLDAREVRDTLAEALTQCIDWPRSVRGLHALGAVSLIEAGPKTVLRDLVMVDQPAVRAYSLASPGGLRELMSQLEPETGGAHREPSEENHLSVLQALLRLLVGTPSRTALPTDDFRDRVRQPYLSLRAAADQVRSGVTAPRSQIEAMATATVSALSAKGFDPNQAQSMVDRALLDARAWPPSTP